MQKQGVSIMLLFSGFSIVDLFSVALAALSCNRPIIPRPDDFH